MPRSPIPLVILLVGVLLATAAVAVPALRAPTFHGTDLGPDSEPRDFALEAADRGTVRLSDFRGKAVVLFFGYTSCPDVCPLTMARLDAALERIGDRRSDVQVLLITVDPDVDTPAKLREYVQGFDLGFTGLGGDRETLAEVARSFGAWGGQPLPTAPPGGDPAASATAAASGHADHEMAPGTTDPAAGTRLIPHTSHIFGIDRSGRLRILWGPERRAEEIAEDLRGLLRL